MAEWRRGEYEVTTERHDFERVARFLRSSYWASQRDEDTIRASIEHSILFSLYKGDEMLGMARVVTDGHTFAWLCDVFMDEAARGQGLGTWLVGIALDSGLTGPHTRWLLATRDAHELYKKFGLEPLALPERFMASGFKPKSMD
ncbi:MAG: GNAT family N-acetyltransferase [Armatimonadetes bacterium]|nr:GNAT family N-acetyltransferase [Armatimonadota bacterium]